MQDKNQKNLHVQKVIDGTGIRAFFENAPDFLVLLGKSCEVIDFNKAAYNFIKTNLKSELNKGDKFVKHVHPMFSASFINKFNEALEGKRSLEEGSINNEKDGIQHWEASFEPARSDDGKIIGMAYIIRDITERKNKEQRISDQNYSLMRIAHIQAHEFRGPLNSIVGIMDLIKHSNYDAPREYLEMLEQSVLMLDGRIRQIITDVDNNVLSKRIADLN
jgi:PAS domain S-box-containing protein